MKKMNIIFRTALLALMFGVTFNINAQWQVWCNGIHYEYTIDKTLRVIAVNGGAENYSGEIVIPSIARVTIYSTSTYMFGEGYEQSLEVTEIGDNAFKNCTGLTRVVLPNSITSIGKNAFYGCTGLTSIEIPNNVKSIGASAFAGCTGLTSITIPNSVTSMDGNVFYGCTALANVTLSKNVTSLLGTFDGCTALTSINIPSSVVKLDGTFDGCTRLASVTLPKSLYYIGEATFDNCAALRSIDMPNSVEYIGTMAFGYTGLTSLELPASVTTLASNAFYGSTALTSVSVRAANPPLMDNSDVFSQEAYNSATLYVPELSLGSYQSADWWRLYQNIVGNAAMNHPYDIESNGIYYLITGPNTVDVTYKDFTYNSYSGTVNIPATVTDNGVTYNVTGIGNSAFRNSSGLTAVNMPDGIKSIGKFAFSRTGLTAMDLPEELTTIGDSAFYSCSSLEDLVIPLNVTTIGTDAFLGVYVDNLTWNPRECWSNGHMGTDNMSYLTIGDQVTVIPDYFAYLSQIRSVTLPASLTTIGSSAFQRAFDLTSLTIPENVTYIGPCAFSETNITSLTWNARECWSNGSDMRVGDFYAMYVPFGSVRHLTIGDQVKVLPHGFVKYSDIYSVTIPESVRFIGNSAFESCSNLSTITVPDGVEEIGAYAFAYTTNLNTLTIGKGVVTFGGMALTGSSLENLIWNARNCDSWGFISDYDLRGYNFTSLTIGGEVEKIPNYMGYGSRITSLELPPSVKTIGDHAFCLCDNLTDLEIPGTVTSIGNNAFYNCNSLMSVTIPESVNRVGMYAFSYCSNLTDVSVACAELCESAFHGCEAISSLTMLPGLETIGNYTFQNCENITSLYFPSTVSNIMSYAFNGCSGLESIVVDPDNPVYDSRDNCNAVIETATGKVVLTCKNSVIPEGITAIGDYAFYNRTDLTSMDIPETVVYIGNYAFAGCTNLAELDIPAGVTFIGSSAFNDCKSLTSMTLPEGITTISSSLFGGCFNLAEVNIPAGVTEIGYQAFIDCRSLTSIDLPDNLETIGASAFTGCYGLQSITIPDLVKTIGASAFQSCTALKSIFIPAAVNSIDVSTFRYCTGLESIKVDANNTVYDSRNNCNAIIHTSSNTLFYGCKKTVIPKTVTKIGQYSFRGCSGLTSIAVPNGVTTIGYDAFWNCTGLTSVMLSPSVTRLDNYAFEGCYNVETFTCLATTPPNCSYSSLNACYNATLMVPEASVATYKAKSYWKNFSNIVGIPGAGPGDANGDGSINITDITLLISAISENIALDNPYADVNGDGVVNITDITLLIYMVLEGE